MKCSLCLEIEEWPLGEALTIVHGYAVCEAHRPLFGVGKTWLEIIWQLRPDRKPPEPEPIPDESLVPASVRRRKAMAGRRRDEVPRHTPAQKPAVPAEPVEPVVPEIIGPIYVHLGTVFQAKVFAAMNGLGTDDLAHRPTDLSFAQVSTRQIIIVAPTDGGPSVALLHMIQARNSNNGFETETVTI